MTRRNQPTGNQGPRVGPCTTVRTPFRSYDTCTVRAPWHRKYTVLAAARTFDQLGRLVAPQGGTDTASLGKPRVPATRDRRHGHATAAAAVHPHSVVLRSQVRAELSPHGRPS